MGSNRSKIKDNDRMCRDSFKFIRLVGIGWISEVWKVQSSQKQHYAIKVMSKVKVIVRKNLSSVINQKQILSGVRHPFIVNAICAFQDRHNLYLVLELMRGGDLRHVLNSKIKLNQRAIRFIILCIAKGLSALRSHNIIHRDLKPENIMFDSNGYCRITDMGIACQWVENNSQFTSGTPCYMAPEVLWRQNHNFCADYYALGVITHELITGKRPYDCLTRNELRDAIYQKQFKMEYNEKVCSLECTNFINKLLQRRAKDRLGYHGVYEIFEHPWLNLTPSEARQFEAKVIQPDFKPKLDVDYKISPIDQKQTDQEKQAMLLLKNEEIQNKFKDYDFSNTNQSGDSEQTKGTNAKLASPRMYRQAVVT